MLVGRKLSPATSASTADVVLVTLFPPDTDTLFSSTPVSTSTRATSLSLSAVVK